ncbi:MAG: hypothetical protein JO299_04170 [Gammaproteobacteria bacterium]|nr:hypothetical protein [Gammaproteobacteria bacterium]
MSFWIEQFLAYADHAAEFYARSGGNRQRALDLTRANAAMRPTRRAMPQLHPIGMTLNTAPSHLRGAVPQ